MPPKNRSGVEDKTDSVDQVFTEWCQMTGWHGILDLRQSKNLLLKTTWFLVISFGAFMAANQCVSLVLDFNSDDQWVTSITYETPRDGGLDWPNMTVCNLNPKFKSEIQRMGLPSGLGGFVFAAMRDLSDDSLLFYDQYQANEPQLTSEKAMSRIREALNNMSQEFLTDKSMRDILANFSPKCNETAIHCGVSSEFDLRQRPVGCCDQNTANEVSDGNCFSIVSNVAFKKSYKNTGHDSAVYVLFDARTTDYMEQILKSVVPSAGLRVDLYFGDPDAAVKTSILVSPGMHTMVSLAKEVHRTKNRRINAIQFWEPGKPCIDKYDYYYVDYSAYSPALCQSDCIVRYTMNVCNCTFLPLSVGLKSGTLCKGNALWKCFHIWNDLPRKMANPKEMETDGQLALIARCWSDCKEACEYTTIDTKVSTAQFPAPVKAQAMTTYLNRAYNNTELNFTIDETKQLSFFEMYFEMKEQRVIEKVARTSLDELVSNLGGALGVWTGLSMLSIYQCLVYFCKAAKPLRCRCRGAKPSPSVVQILY